MLIILPLLVQVALAEQLAALAPSFFGMKAAIRIHSSVPPDCKLKASTAMLTLGSGCMGLDHLFHLSSALGQPNMTSTILESFGSDSFVSALCSPRCSAATEVFESDLSPVCGDAALIEIQPFNTSMTSNNDTNTTMTTSVTNITKPINVAYIVSFVKSLSAVSCFRVNETSKWCANELYDYLKENNVPITVEGLSSQFIKDSNVSCSSCTIRTVEAAKNQTSFVEYEAIRPALDAISQITKTCKPKTTSGSFMTHMPVFGVSSMFITMVTFSLSILF